VPHHQRVYPDSFSFGDVSFQASRPLPKSFFSLSAVSVPTRYTQYYALTSCIAYPFSDIVMGHFLRHLFRNYCLNSILHCGRKVLTDLSPANSGTTSRSTIGCVEFL
jgi:hypothetical protein